MEDLEKVVQHYLSVFNYDSSSISPTILNYFKMVLEKHSIEDILHAIDLSFEELKGRRKLHATKVLNILQKNLSLVLDTKIQIKPDKSEVHTEEYLNRDQEGQENHSWNIWKSFFYRHNIPKSLINKKELEKIPLDLRNFYIATKVCEYIYSTMPLEERKKVDRMVESRLKLINISPQQDVEEVKRLLRIHFVKKIYGIPY